MGLAALAGLAGPAAAQGPARTAPAAAAPAPAPAQTVLPDPATAAKMIWSVLTAVDHADMTDNYSVLRGLGSPSFQARNSDASLAATFQHLRAERVDLSAVLLVQPVYDIPPTMVEGNLMRVRGIFPLRPEAIAFDLLFQPVGGRWALHGIAVAPVASTPPGAAPRQ